MQLYLGLALVLSSSSVVASADDASPRDPIDFEKFYNEFFCEGALRQDSRENRRKQGAMITAMIQESMKYIQEFYREDFGKGALRQDSSESILEQRDILAEMIEESEKVLLVWKQFRQGLMGPL